MEKIYTFTALLKSFAVSYWLIAVFLLFGSVFLVGVRVHSESYNFGAYVDDEYHTIHQGLNLLVNGRVDNFRAQESTRWLVRAFYPYSLVYMNTHMGGNVYINGWTYPGHNYVVKNFVSQSSSPSAFNLDPNLRDLFHSLRQQYILFVFAAVILLLLFFFKEKYYLVAFGTILLLGFNLDLLEEQKIFYIEPAMLASIALLMLAYCYFLYRGFLSNWSAILFGFLCAFMVATKFSTFLFVLLPVILFFYLLQYKDALKQTGTYMLSLAVFYVLINFPAFVSLESFNAFLHDFFSNFWQYAAGSDPNITVAPGFTHLGLIINQLEGLLGYSLYILPVVAAFALYYSSTKERMVLVPVAALTLLSILSLSGQHVYLLRNAIPFYLPVAIIALLSAEIVARKLMSLYSWNNVYAGIFALSLLWFVGIVAHAGGIDPFASKLYPDPRYGIVSGLQVINNNFGPSNAWYAVGFSSDFFKGEVFEKRITAKNGAPDVLNSNNYNTLASQFSSMPAGSVVVVNNVGNNKHLTNYILPKYFNRNVQFGSYYVFFSDLR